MVRSIALSAAGYSMIHKLLTDKTLRLRRSGGVNEEPEKKKKKKKEPVAHT